MTRAFWVLFVILSVLATQSASAETTGMDNTRSTVKSSENKGTAGTTTSTTTRAPLGSSASSSRPAVATPGTASTTRSTSTVGTTATTVKPATSTTVGTTAAKPATMGSVTGATTTARPVPGSVTGATTTAKPAMSTTGAVTSGTVRKSAGIAAPSGTRAAIPPASVASTTATPAKPTTAPTTPATTAKPATSAAAGQQYDYGDYTSETLATKAWESLNGGDYAAVEAYAGKCIDMFDTQAIEQSQSLTNYAPKDKAFNYWALNDVATAHFILGQARLAQGRVKEAQKEFQTVIDKYPFAQCWDPSGWFWHVAEAANDKLSTIGTPYDFGDYTSSTLTVKAWEALGKNDTRGVELFVKKTFELYEAEAKKQQASLTDFAPKDKAFDYWALNDVGTSYFILGESLMNQKKYPEAKAAFERVINDFGYSQCWDPKGWFWKPAQGAKDRIKKIQVLQQL